MLSTKLTPEDLKWLTLVRESELHDRKHRPLPVVVQTRLRGLGLIDLRRHKFVLTAAGQRALKEGLDP
jgi:hypothetical protein